MNNVNPNFSMPSTQANSIMPGGCDPTMGNWPTRSTQPSIGFAPPQMGGVVTPGLGGGLEGIVAALVQTLTQVVNVLSSLVMSLFNGGQAGAASSGPGLLPGSQSSQVGGGAGGVSGAPSAEKESSGIGGFLSDAYDFVTGMFSKGEGDEEGLSISGVLGDIFEAVGPGKIAKILGKVGGYIKGFF